jgi:hypothetical protein
MSGAHDVIEHGEHFFHRILPTLLAANGSTRTPRLLALGEECIVRLNEKVLSLELSYLHLSFSVVTDCL